MKQPLPPYNPSSRCLACDATGDRIASRFVDEVSADPRFGEVDESYLLRRCTRCRFEWRERPLYFDKYRSSKDALDARE